MMLEKPILIRSIQHYMYCPRRFALLEINQDWAENAAVVNANLLHENVHSDKPRYLPKGVIAKNSVTVWNDELSILGVCDCIEFVPDKNGVTIPYENGKFRVRIVEYKPTAPKNEPFHFTDAIQVYAQKICADSIWKCNSEAYIYYDSTRKRVKLPFDATPTLKEDSANDNYYEILLKCLSEMKRIINSHIIPPCKKGQNCSGCSLHNDCFPKSSFQSVKKMINQTLDE